MTDTHIAELVGMPPADWQVAAIVLERDGLVRPDPLFANKRYWPAVKAFLDRRYNLNNYSGGGNVAAVDGEEQWKPNMRRASSAGKQRAA